MNLLQIRPVYRQGTLTYKISHVVGRLRQPDKPINLTSLTMQTNHTS